MPGELKELLDAFTTFGTRYSDNAQEVISDPDGKRLAAVYAAGMTGAMSGLSETLGGVYDELPDPRRGDLDRLVATSGALEMLAKANELVGSGSLETAEGLVTAQDVVKKIKAILRQILGELKLTPGSATPGTEEGKAAGLHRADPEGDRPLPRQLPQGDAAPAAHARAASARPGPARRAPARLWRTERARPRSTSDTCRRSRSTGRWSRFDELDLMTGTA